MKKPPSRSRAPNRLRKLAACRPGRAEADRDHRDGHRKPAELQREQELADELAAVRDTGGLTAAIDRLAGQDHHVPDLLEQALAGRNARSATAPTIPLSDAPVAASSGAADGHPPETLTRHQFISAPSGPIRGADLPGRASLLAGLGAETTSQRWPAGSATIASRTSRARRSRRDAARRGGARRGEPGEQRVAGARRARRRRRSAARGGRAVAARRGRSSSRCSSASSASSRPICRRSSRRAAPSSASSQESPSSSSAASSAEVELRSTSGSSAPSGSLASSASGSAAETSAVIATSRGSTPAARAASIASAAIRSTSREPAARSAT